jgi:membrane fusion protein (multidrug efflux system)
MNDMSSIDARDAIDAPAGTVPERRLRQRLIMVSVPMLVVAAGAVFWLTGGRTVSTDNAQINAQVAEISSEVSGRVTDVLVTENQVVHKGDLLLRIDQAPYRIALMQADAAVGNAQLSIAQLVGAFHSKQADTSKSASDVGLARDTLKRQEQLLAQGFTTRATYDAAKAGLAAAEAQQASDASSAESARAMLGTSRAGGHPQVEAAMAMREKAALDLART